MRKVKADNKNIYKEMGKITKDKCTLKSEMG